MFISVTCMEEAFNWILLQFVQFFITTQFRVYK